MSTQEIKPAVPASQLIGQLGGKLTEREKWLMQKAFDESIWYRTLDEWLEDHITDGVTVEMELVKEAP